MIGDIVQEIEKVKASSTIEYFSETGIGYNNQRAVKITIDGYQYFYTVTDNYTASDSDNNAISVTYHKPISSLIDMAIEDHIKSDDYKKRYKHW
jgi:hypothetical protein